MEFIARSTGLNESGVCQVLLELWDAVIFFNFRGQPVKLEGLGTYTPTIDLDGTIGVGHWADMEIKNRLNAPGEFRGELECRPPGRPGGVSAGVPPPSGSRPAEQGGTPGFLIETESVPCRNEGRSW